MRLIAVTDFVVQEPAFNTMIKIFIIIAAVYKQWSERKIDWRGLIIAILSRNWNHFFSSFYKI